MPALRCNARGCKNATASERTWRKVRSGLMAFSGRRDEPPVDRQATGRAHIRPDERNGLGQEYYQRLLELDADQIVSALIGAIYP
jgi:hypothetical protein